MPRLTRKRAIALAAFVLIALSIWSMLRLCGDCSRPPNAGKDHHGPSQFRFKSDMPHGS